MVDTERMFTLIVIIFSLQFNEIYPKHNGMLYPRDSESRSLRRLDGMWNFRTDNSPNRSASFAEMWFSVPLSKNGPVIPMPVPSSYNDITQEKSIRDFVGWAWYDREFYVEQEWQNKRVVLRIDSAHYNTIVWLNSVEAVRHVGGHLPFEADVSKLLHYTGVNRVTMAVNNTLTPTTLPPGSINYATDRNRYPPGYFTQDLQFDFFNYAGIHRHVTLYTTPVTYVSDITIVTNIQNNNGLVKYTVVTDGTSSQVPVKVEVVDKEGHVVGTSNNTSDTITVTNANLWWPYTMNPGNTGYLYTLKVTAGSDVYRQPFGIRTVFVSSNQFLINGKPFYCHGVAKHEDSDIRGKGLDYPLIAKDFNMLKWLGANCFRTSHYPYAEEIMDQADQQGIVVIDECPGVGINKVKRSKTCRYKQNKTKCRTTEPSLKKGKSERKKGASEPAKKRTRKEPGVRKKSLNLGPDNFGNASLEHHKEVMTEMYQRDKNRPAVVMWSVANEPASSMSEAGPYFKSVIEHVRQLDSTRPVTAVLNVDSHTDLVGQYLDLICLNRYFAWYSDCGHTELIQMQLLYDLRGWNQKHNKPMIMTEYGADTVAGFHQDPSFVFTEEFQVEFMREYHKGFDTLRKEFLVGEMVWNFADFMTAQSITRVVGNKKGVLTRQRQPKMSGHLLRDRYYGLMNQTVSDALFFVRNMP